VKIFFQHEDESIIINGDISVKVIEINGGEVVLAIEAPAWMEVNEIEPSRLEECSLLRPR